MRAVSPNESGPPRLRGEPLPVNADSNAVPSRAGERPHPAAGTTPALLLCQLLVDDALELLEGLGAGELVAVDEEGWRAGDADLGARLLVRLHHLGLLVRVEALVELALVEPELLRVALQRRHLERLLAPEEADFVRPVLALVTGALGGLGGLL